MIQVVFPLAQTNALFQIMEENVSKSVSVLVVETNCHLFNLRKLQKFEKITIENKYDEEYNFDFITLFTLLVFVTFEADQYDWLVQQ